MRENRKDSPGFCCHILPGNGVIAEKVHGHIWDFRERQLVVPSMQHTEIGAFTSSVAKFVGGQRGFWRSMGGEAGTEGDVVVKVLAIGPGC